VHEYQGRFGGQSSSFKFTAVTGHVLSIDFLPEFNNWDAVKPIELFKAATQKSEANPKARMCRHLREEAKGCDAVVLWLDCDREGENICFEVLDEVKPALNRPRHKDKQTVFRAFFSAITQKEIKRAMETLGHPNRDESLSVDARQELDLRMGCAFTRFQTRYFQGKYGDLDSSLISYGPCQTPTLGFCVDRHDHIQGFQPEPFWVIDARVCYRGSLVSLNWGRVRLFDHEVAAVFLDSLKGCGTAKVTAVVKKEKSRPRPVGLNTVELMRGCSAGLGMGPHHAMQIAERLYLKGYISYPRTETTAYSETFDLREALEVQVASPVWGEAARDLLRDSMQRPHAGRDVGDHPPITPVQLAREDHLSGDEWRVYDLVARHFIATLSPDLRYLQTTIHWLIGAESFKSSGKHVTDPGFTRVMHWLSPTEEEFAPDVETGLEVRVDTCKLSEHQTSAPTYLTESELITLMEKHRIGTDASIPVHINNICERNFVKVGPGRTLVPTTLGIVLVHGYLKIDPELVLPTMRATVEQQLNLIATGQANFHEVLDHTVSAFEEKFAFFASKIERMDELFEVSFSPLSQTGKPMSRCAKCRRFMKYIQQQPARLYCSTCDETYALPNNGKIMLSVPLYLCFLSLLCLCCEGEGATCACAWGRLSEFALHSPLCKVRQRSLLRCQHVPFRFQRCPEQRALLGTRNKRAHSMGSNYCFGQLDHVVFPTHFAPFATIIRRLKAHRKDRVATSARIRLAAIQSSLMGFAHVLSVKMVCWCWIPTQNPIGRLLVTDATSSSRCSKVLIRSSPLWTSVAAARRFCRWTSTKRKPLRSARAPLDIVAVCSAMKRWQALLNFTMHRCDTR
jgi:DNA topoisomerase-3